MSPEEKTCKRREKLFLKMIEALAKEDYNPRGLLRTLLTCWFAHYKVVGLFTRTGNPKWLNTKDIEKIGLHHFDDVSVNALKILGTGPTGRKLVVDHATPIATIWKKIRRKSYRQIARELPRLLRLAIVTRLEHEGPLAKPTLASSRKRYREAGVKLAKRSDVNRVAKSLVKRKVKKKSTRKRLAKE